MMLWQQFKRFWRSPEGYFVESWAVTMILALMWLYAEAAKIYGWGW
jgi:hypothetical protein